MPGFPEKQGKTENKMRDKKKQGSMAHLLEKIN